MDYNNFRDVTYYVELDPPAAPLTRIKLLLTRNGSFVREAARNATKFIRFRSWSAADRHVAQLIGKGYPAPYMRLRRVEEYITEFKDY